VGSSFRRVSAFGVPLQARVWPNSTALSLKGKGMSSSLRFHIVLTLLCGVGYCGSSLADDSPDELRAAELREAARMGDLATVTRLLDAGIPVDAPARNHVTPLMLAAERGNMDVVRLLLERGADLNAKESFFNSSVVAGALNYKRVEIAKLLLVRGAKDRAAALQWAVENSDVELARTALALPGIEPLDLAAARRAAEEKKDDGMVELLSRASVERRAVPVSVDAAILGRYTGRYRNEQHVVEVQAIENGLSVKVDDAEPLALVSIDPQRFETPQGDFRLEIRGRAGTVEWAVVTRADGEVSFLTLASGAELTGPQQAAEVQLQSGPRDAARPWPQFRGPSATGIGDGQGVTADWDMATGHHVRFKTPIPGIGLASPIIDNGQIFIATAVSSKGDTTFRTGNYGDGDSVDDLSPHSFRLYCLDARDGSITWERELANAAPTVKRHLKSSFANSTPATDGRRVVALFGMIGLLVCVDRDGNELWRRELGVLEANDPQAGIAEWGHASSPIIWEDLVIVQADRRADSFLAAFSMATGEEVWRVPRDERSTWATPTVVSSPLGDELVTNGMTIRAYQPRTGEPLWSLGPNSEVIVGTPVAGEAMVYVTGGYPPVRPVYAIRAGSRGDLSLPANASSSQAIAWSHLKGGTYLPTPLLYRDHLVTLNNNGVLTAYQADSGEQVHRVRLASSATAFSASPTAADGRIFAISEQGDVYVLKGEPGYELLATHPLGEVVMSTPAMSGGLLVIRTLSHVIGIAEDHSPASP